MTQYLANRRRQRKPVTDDDRIRRRDAKLWQREQAAAAMNSGFMLCPCTDCEGFERLHVGRVERHLRENGRDPLCRLPSTQVERDSSDEEWEQSECTIPSSTHGAGGHRPNWYIPPSISEPTPDPEPQSEPTPDPEPGPEVGTGTRFDQMVRDLFAGVNADSEAANEDFDPNSAFEHVDIDSVPDSPDDDGYYGSQLWADAHKRLFKDSKQTVLEFTISIVNACLQHRVPLVFVETLMNVLRTQTLPEPNLVPRTLYYAKKMIKDIGMDFQTIHACPSGCILYRKEYADLIVCPKCTTARYLEGSKIPVHTVRYFPVIPRLLRMFKCPSISKLMTWAHEHRSRDGLVYHPRDCKQFRHLSSMPMFSDFLKDPRNVLFALCLDGVNPFNEKSSKHSVWPIMLVNYGLPPWLSTKPFFVMLSILVCGTKELKSLTQESVDVFIEPLMEDLQILWRGVEAYDCLGRYGSHRFTLRGMLFWTVNDYPALGHISGLCTGGYRGCSICGHRSSADFSTILNKPVHLGYRKMLPMDHVWRTARYAHLFNGEIENDPPPPRQSATEILEYAALKREWDALRRPGRRSRRVDDPYLTYGVKRRSVLFNLPYWMFLPVRHCIDVMHMEKNVMECLLGFLLGMKDTEAVREDMRARNIRPHLWMTESGGKPPAPYVLTESEKITFLKRLKHLKVSDGYCGNWREKIEFDRNGETYSLWGMKSHDHHVLMQQLLRPCLRGLLAPDVRRVIFKLCDIFETLCSRAFDPSTFEDFRTRTILTMCELEIHFPPAFFNISIHLIPHAVEELEWCGPVQNRWMYWGERMLNHYTRYSANRARVGGSISACYVREEAMGYATEYMADMTAYRTRVWDSQEELDVIGEQVKGAPTTVTLCRKEADQIHDFVLRTVNILEPWRRKYDELLEDPTARDRPPPFAVWLEAEMDRQILENPGLDLNLFYISKPPSSTVTSYRSMWAYGNHHIVMDARAKKSPTYNSGIAGYFPGPMEEGSSEMSELLYVGELTHIYHMPYHTTEPVIILKAKWVKPQTQSVHPSVRVVDGLTEVNFKQLMRPDVDPFVFPASVHQVFFLHDDNPRSGWRVVLKSEPRRRRTFDTCTEEDMESS